jgi:drug/metabolite transporter (DMT)-like permease
MCLVGTYVALSKPLAAALPVFLLAWLRFGIGAVAMLPWLKKPASEAPLSPRLRGLVFIESFFGNFLFTICMVYGVSMTNAVSAGVIMASIPAVVALLSWALLGERITLRTWAAVACGAIGIALLSLSKHELPAAHTGSASQGLFSYNSPMLGNALIMASVLCEGIYAVVGKKLTGTLGPKRISALINLWGLVLMTPMGLYLALSFDFAAPPTSVWLLLVFYALAASVWTVWLWMTGLRAVPAAQAGVFAVLLPISAAVVGVVFLGESVNALQLLAFAIALAGVVLATLPTRAQAMQERTL